MLNKIINILNNGGRWNIGKIRYYVCRFLIRIRTIKHNMYYITKWDISLIEDRLRRVDDTRIDDKLACQDDIKGIKDKLSDLESDIDDKCSEYQVEDVIYNLMGSSEDYVNYDDMYDVKDDIKVIKSELNTIVNEDLKTIENIIHDIQNVDKNDGGGWIKGDYNVLIDDVIETIINRLKYIKQ